jgi:Autophagy-related protein 13
MANANHPMGGTTTTSAAATSGPRAKCDQVIFECLCKACEIIVGSRAPQSSSSGSASQRFNLQIPEIGGVRSILAQYRMQLHVPIRLDVYFQHAEPDSSRELLERWCLEYRPCNAERFLNSEAVVTHDPMVQLTHVCKRIVLWLRTLYCWARLLPCRQIVAVAASGGSAHGATRGGSSNNIGFAMYVKADGNDDLTDLTSNQGFSLQSRSNGVVTTPYGELTWQVYYNTKLEHLIAKSKARTPSVRIQVPQQQQQQNRPLPMNSNSSSGNGHAVFAPHSAPTRPPLSYTERSQQKRLEAQQQQQKLMEQRQGGGKSYDPRNMLYRRSQTSQTGDGEHHNIPILRRNNTSIGGQSSPARSSVCSNSDQPPERVLSGLSLALMMADNQDDKWCEDDDGGGAANKSSDDGELIHLKDGDADRDEQEEEEATVEEQARRAALHELPPHYMLEQQHHFSASGTGAGEYGYGYNNHIPWQKIHPSNTNPASVGGGGGSTAGDYSPSTYAPFGRTLSSSPASLTSPLHHQTPPTPSGAAFLGATPPAVASMAHYLIPPRNRSNSTHSREGSVTPPFQPRPAGFLHEALQLEPTHPSPLKSTMASTPTSDRNRPAMTSLDSLRSSPFQQSQAKLNLPPDSRSSLLSSLVPDHSASLYSCNPMLDSDKWNFASSGLLPSLMGSAGPLQYHSLDHYANEEMPFAVDLPTPSSSSSTLLQGSLSSNKQSRQLAPGALYLGNSSALASLAQQCSAPHRLKFFEREERCGPTDPTAIENMTVDLVSSLAEQLQEMRAFGASLHIEEQPGYAAETSGDLMSGSGGNSSSTSTPISLRS